MYSDVDVPAHLRSPGPGGRGVLVCDLQHVLELALLDQVLAVRLQRLELDDDVVLHGAGDAAPRVRHEVAVDHHVRGAQLHLPQLVQNKVNRFPEYFTIFQCQSFNRINSLECWYGGSVIFVLSVFGDDVLPHVEVVLVPGKYF